MNGQNDVDALTGAIRREFARSYFDLAVKHVQQGNGKLLCACVDINEFKNINDIHGHSAGDAALSFYAKKLIQTVIGGHVFRYGGDEFLVLCECEDRASAIGILRDICRISGSTVELGSVSFRVSASVGGSLFPDDSESLGYLIEAADRTMYHAKKENYNDHLFSEEIEKKLKREEIIRRSFSLAIKKGDFKLAYQPVICLANGTLNGFETLARWTHEELGVIGPSEFIPIAESSGVMAELGWYVLESGVLQMKKWMLPPYNFLGFLSINVSGIQLRDESFAKRLMKFITTHGVNPNRIALEITETQNVETSSTAKQNIMHLRKFGLQMYMDDFGVGYSSLSVLGELKFDKVKIDRKFTSSLKSPGSQSARIIQAISLMAKSLGMGVVAEGIETELERTFLRSFLCTEGQGYLFSRPLWPDDVEENWLNGRREALRRQAPLHMEMSFLS